MAARLVSLLLFVHFAQGYTKFSPNCSIPTSNTNFVQSPNSRGTLDILWSCLFTIFACTWTVLHLNVPEQREELDPNWKVDLKWRLKGFWGSLKWMLIMIIAPEVFLGKTCGEWAWVRSDHKRLVKIAAKDGVPWSKTHTYFANMGGFVIRTKRAGLEPDIGDDLLRNGQPSQSTGEDTTPKIQSPENAATQTPTTKQGTVDAVEQKDKISTPITPSIKSNKQDEEQAIHFTYHGTHVHLIAPLIIELRERGILSTLPHITIDEINDRSKNDTFVRVIAIFQIVSMAVQIMIRYAKDLAVSQLELAVIAFAVCAIITYLFNLNKPQGVKVPIPILRYDAMLPEEIGKVLVDYQRVVRASENLISTLRLTKHYTVASNVDNSWTLDTRNGVSELVGLFLGSLVFGSVHIFAWKFTFPTPFEQIAWRISSVFCTCAILILFLAFYLLGAAKWWLVIMLYSIVALVIAIFYFLARLFMVIEMFRCLLYLPPSAYISTWAANIPQIS